jgi:hypothetical protein
VYGLTLLYPPTSEPVSLTEAKLHCRVDGTQDDTRITSLIVAARTWCEKSLGKQMVQATWKQTMDHFPSAVMPPSDFRGYPASGWRLTGERSLPWPECATIRLQRSPLQSVTAVNYVDGDGTTQTVDPSTYLVDTSRDPGRIAPAYGKLWPVARYQQGAVSVTFVAGYDVVPETIRQAILLLVGHWFENREAVNVGNIVTPLQFAVESLLGTEHNGEYC